MSWLAKLVVDRFIAACVLLMLVALMTIFAVGELTRIWREGERQALLKAETERRGLEVMSQTVNGNLMGAIAMLGMMDTDIKHEAKGKLAANSPQVDDMLQSVGLAFSADGAFVVAENGTVASSWDMAGKSTTGIDLKFRPYFLMALQGSTSVYAAVSLTRGDRALYFAAPVFSEGRNATDAIGAVVARISLIKINSLLHDKDKADMVLLLSPQGVVFTSSREEWVGYLTKQPTPERLKEIRALKQFGDLFESREPVVLPISVGEGIQYFDGRRYASATAAVEWNDPDGDWTLVMLEDIERTVPLAVRLRLALPAGLVVLLLGAMLLYLLRGHHAKVVATEKLAVLTRTQQQDAERKTRLAAAMMQMQKAGDRDELVRLYLAELHHLLGVLQGVVYLGDAADGNLELAGSYACMDQPPTTLALGEGLLGQCAIERRTQVIAMTADGFGTIRSGLGSVQPVALILSPLLLGEILLGVVEVAMLTLPEKAELEQFEEMNGFLALNVEILGRSTYAEYGNRKAIVASASNTKEDI